VSTYRVGIIGCGSKHPNGQWGGIAQLHAYGYQRCRKTRIVACADINLESGERFAEMHHAPGVYTDYKKMLKREQLDLVSVCVWPALHAEMTVAAARANVKGILCEKPMAINLPEADRMLRACDQHGVALSINHQRRLSPTFIAAKKLAKSGLIGPIRRLEGVCDNIYDWGTHWIDMMRFFNDDVDADWVLAGLDARNHRQVFRAYVDDQAVALIHFTNGMLGVLYTGNVDALGGASNRIEGAEGFVDVRSEAQPVRALTAKKGWVIPDVPNQVHGAEAFAESVKDLVRAVGKGTRPELDGRRGRATLEIILAIMESSRRRARVDLPLKVKDNPLQSMIEAGMV